MSFGGGVWKRGLEVDFGGEIWARGWDVGVWKCGILEAGFGSGIWKWGLEESLEAGFRVGFGSGDWKCLEAGFVLHCG